MKKMLALLLAAIMLLSLAACAKTEAPEETLAEQTEAQAPAEDDSKEIGGVDLKDDVQADKSYKEHVNLSVWSNVQSLDSVVQNTGASVVMYNMFANQLVTLNEEENTFEPELAESFEIVNLTTSKFTLKKGIHFSNGEELTSEDVKFSLLDRPGTVEGAIAAYYKKIDSIEIIDDYNFIIHLNQPDPEILYALAEIECTILNKKACEESADGYLIGTGGYKVTEWVPGDKVEMEKFDDSFVWTEEGTTPTRTLTIKCMTEGSISAVQAGDVANALCAKEDLSYLNEDANVETLTFRTWGVWMLAMNQHEGSVFYDDPNLQKAVVAAFDRNMMCQFVNGEGDEAPDSLFPYYMFGYTNEYEFAKFDLDKAKEYLAASNHPDGNVTVRVLTHTNANYTAQVTVLQSMLETNLGIKVDVQQLDKAGRNAALSEGTSYDIYLMDYTAAPNGSKLQNRFELGNAADWANYSNPEIDQLYLDYLSTNDEEAQKTALARIQEIGAEELPYVPYAYQTCPVVYAKGVSGLNWKTSTKFDFHRVVWEEA